MANIGFRNKQYIAKIICYVLLMGIVGVGFNTHSALAQSLSGQIIQQTDLDGDGQPDMTILSASLSTPNDKVIVYDGAHNMERSTDWHTATDFRDDTWVFDRGGDDTAQLIIQFSTIGNTTIASVYSDLNKDNKVDYTVNGHTVTVTESKFPPIKVIVDGDWFLPDGELNWNVRFETDGSSVVHLHTYNLTDVWNRGNVFPFDGTPDIEMQFRDENHDGIPEYGIWRVVSPTPGSEGSMRTWIWSNEGRHRPSQPTNTLFWPYITTSIPFEAAPGGIALPQSINYFDVPPIISYSLDAGTIRQIAFSGYPIEQGYHVNSLQPSEPGKVNYADFENIQAYYDLADDHDGVPELHIRNRYFDADDPYNIMLKVPTDEIRYSWNQANKPGLTWDYKLGLAGRQLITSTITLGDFQYRIVPFAEQPNWVTNNSWDYASFIALESANPYASTEGIYAWGAIESLYRDDPNTISRYLEGTAVIDINEPFQNLPTNFRGDFAPDLQAQPYLYFSPIDGKLHLLKAHHGVWQVDDASSLRYANLDGDSYLDQWTYTHVITGEQTITSTSQLDVAASHMLYSDASSVIIRQAAAQPALFTTLPPTSHAEWQALGAKLDANKRDLAPDNLRAMMEQFAGPEMQISGATLRDYRPLGGGGFRFVLELRPGFAAQGADLLALGGLTPGNYLVQFDQSFTIQPLTAAALAIDFAPDSAGPAPATAMLNQPQNLHMRLSNSGLDDAHTVQVRAEASLPGGDSVEIGQQTVAVAGGGTTPLDFSWVPHDTGEWQITISATPLDTAGQSVAPATQRTLTRNVAPVQRPGYQQSASIFGVVPIPALFGLLGAVLGLFAVVIRYMQRASTQQRS